ncbi:MAG: tripartite tricarboxylate transporter substrate binding protein [Trueperaceae bacterium]
MKQLHVVASRFVLFLLVISLFGVAAGQSYPSKPLTFVVPWPAGGTTDIIGRLLANAMSEELGRPVAVVNRVGGGGSLGTKSVLDSPDGGHTVLVTTSGNHILTPLKNDVGYEHDDFTPIGQVSVRSLGLAVQGDAPWQNLSDLAEDAAANPGRYTFAAVPDVLPFLTVQSWADAAGIELTHIPQQGDAPGVTGVLGGHYDMVPASLDSVESQVAAGSMRLLAVFSAERDPAAPDVPTAIEQGYDVIGNPWTGLAVSGDAPDEAVEALRQALANVVEDPEFAARADQAGATVNYTDGPAFGEQWARDWNAYEPILRPAGN